MPRKKRIGKAARDTERLFAKKDAERGYTQPRPKWMWDAYNERRKLDNDGAVEEMDRNLESLWKDGQG